MDQQTEGYICLSLLIFPVFDIWEVKNWAGKPYASSKEAFDKKFYAPECMDFLIQLFLS